MTCRLIRRSSVFLILVILTYGCASFSTINHADYTYDQIHVPAQKHSVDYDVATTWDMGLAKGPGRLTDKMNQGGIDETIRKAFEQSRLFSLYHAGNSGADYLITFKINILSDVMDGFPLKVANIFTATLVPARYRQDFTMTVHVQKGDKVLKMYRYDQRVDVWIQTFLIFAMPFYPPTKPNIYHILDHMLLVFLHDLAEDKLLETPT